MMDRGQKIATTLGLILLLIDLGLSFRSEFNLEGRQVLHTSTESSVEPGPYGESSIGASLYGQTPHPLFQNPIRIRNQTPSLSKTESMLCQLAKRTDIPIEGDLRVQTFDRTEGGATYWLKSSDCPDELYSIVWIDRDGRIDKEINCKRTTLTELTLNSGIQWNIEMVPKEKNSRPMAISGSGRFLVNCPDTGLTLTRDGRFRLKSGTLENSEGCIAWTREGGGRKVVFADGDSLDDRGCSETTRECFDLYEPDERDPEAFNFKTSKSLMVLNERGLKRSHSGILFESALEDLDTADRSLTGVGNWETTPVTKAPTVCP